MDDQTPETAAEIRDHSRMASATARAEINGLSMALTDARKEIERLQAEATDARELRNLVQTMIITDLDMDVWRHTAAQVLKGTKQ